MSPKISAETRVKLSTQIFFNKVLRKILLRVEGEFRVGGSGVTIERSNGNRVKLSTWVSLISYLFLLILRKILLRVEGEFRASAWEDEEDEILLS